MGKMNDVNRREFLQSGVAGGAALLVGFYLPARVLGRVSTSVEDEVFKPNAWIRMTTDNQITVLVEIPEMGQGPRTADAMILADELEANWSTIRVEQAPVIPGVYHHLSTGGSDGVRTAWSYLRQAGAYAREILLTAAAKQWGVSKLECRAENGTIIHSASSRHFTYGELVGTASRLPPIKTADIPLKQPKDFRFIGKPIPRVDVPSKVDGSAKFGIDVRIPGMLFAVVAHCPYLGGKLISFDATSAKAVPGVRDVFPVLPIGFMKISPEVTRNIHSEGGVAVVAESTWSAIEGRRALKIAWDKGPAANESTESLQKMIRRLATAPPSLVAVKRGDAPKALEGAARKVEATYELPFQAHAAMEPMNSTVSVRDDRIEVWSPTQWGEVLQDEIAQLSGFPRDKVTVHMTLCGGSFGRRGQWDYAAQAWQVAREVKRPVQLLWTREDDIQHDFYRQYSYHRMVGGIDRHGNPVAWLHRIVSTPIRPVFDLPELLKDPRHVASAELGGADVLPYAIPNFSLDYAPAHSAVPRAWWRSVEHSFTAFAKECFVDELAHAAGRDPYQFRMSLLAQGHKLHDAAKQPGAPSAEKFQAVLRLAAAKSGWGRPLPVGSGRGIACHYSFGSYVAQVAEVSVEKNGTVHVNRVVGAVDCGIAVNPDGVRAMTEGAINFALTPVLSGEITIKDAAVEQSNFNDYQVLRMSDAPEIEVHLISSNEDPQGMGEPGVHPLAPAVANAVFAATGMRLRRLPINTQLLSNRRSSSSRL